MMSSVMRSPPILPSPGLLLDPHYVEKSPNPPEWIFCFLQLNDWAAVCNFRHDHVVLPLLLLHSLPLSALLPEVLNTDGPMLLTRSMFFSGLPRWKAQQPQTTVWSSAPTAWLPSSSLPLSAIISTSSASSSPSSLAFSAEGPVACCRDFLSTFSPALLSYSWVFSSGDTDIQ